MLNANDRSCAALRVGGFSLIELMVSVVIGMIVMAGAVNLVVAIDKSNSETIQASRLTQELRSLAGVIAYDLRRARRIEDPVAAVGQGSLNACPVSPVTPNQPCYSVTTSGTSGCMFYGYTGTIGQGNVFNYRFIWLNGSNIELDQFAFDPTAVAVGTAVPIASTFTNQCPLTTANAAPANTVRTVATLNASNQVKITSLCMSSTADAGSCYFDNTTNLCQLNSIVPATNEIDVCVSGQLIAGDTYTKTLTRAFVQPIFVRSGAP